jgi:hypothetical protein
MNWQFALVGSIFLVDLVVFMGLIRQDLREWLADRST